MRSSSFGVQRWSTAGAVTGMLSCMCVAWGGGPASSTQGFAVLLGAFGAWAGSRLGRVLHDKRQARRWGLLEARAEPSTVRAAGEGWVRLVGVVRALEPVLGPGEVPCVAWASRSLEGDGAVASRFHDLVEGGSFELDDGSGEVARVDARHLRLLGVDLGDTDEVLLRDGARCEVTGLAARVPLPEALGPVPHRSMATRLELYGTESHPVVLRPVGWARHGGR